MSSGSVNHLSSIQDNPFIRHYGLPNHTSQRDSKCVLSAFSHSKSCDSQNDDQEQEYHVNSGFVHKLRSKFAQLETKSKQASLSRKSASVENLLTFDNHSSMDNFQHGCTNLTSDDSCIVLLSKLEGYAPVGYKTQMKLRNQDVNQNIDKAPSVKNNIISSAKPPLPAPRHQVLKSSSRNGTAKVRSAHCDKWAMAPDVELIGRDNMIIIESNKLSKSLEEFEAQKNTKDSTKIANDDLKLVKPLTSMENVKDEHDLQKPKTVSAYRTLFESNPNAVSEINKEESPRTSVNLNTGTIEIPMDRIGSSRNSIIFATNDSSLTNVSFSRQDSTQHINTASISEQKSQKLFQNSYVDKGPTVEIKGSSSDDKSQNKTRNITQLNNISNAQHALNSVHPNSKVFDSKSNKSTEKVDQPIHSKSQVVVRRCVPKDTIDLAHKPYQRRSREFESVNCQKTPKDTIELKHEADRRSLELENVNSPKIAKDTIELKHEADHRRSLKLENANSPWIPKDTIELKHEANHRRSLELENVTSPKIPKDAVKIKLAANHKRSLELENVNSQKIPKDTIELKHETERRSLELEERNNQNSEIEFRNDVVNSQASADNKNEINAGVSVTVDTAPGKLSSRKVFDSSSIFKKDKKPQKVEIYQVKNVSNSTVTNNVLEKVAVVDDLDILQVEQNKKQTEPDSSDTANMSAISDIEAKINKNKFKVQDPNLLQAPSQFSKDKKDSQSSPTAVTVENVEAPVSGMSTFLTSRLKKSQPDHENLLAATYVQPANGCSPAPAPRKRRAPEPTDAKGSLDVEMTNEKSSPPLPSTPVPELPNTNIDDVVRTAKKSPQQATKMVFDSSKIATKRKEPPKRKSQTKTMNELNNYDQLDSSVPKSDLFCTANEKLETDYQEGYIPTVIQPCPYMFIGAEVIFDKTPYKKSKKVKVKISFDDHAATFEYQAEELALENYLEEHPEERVEVVKQEKESSMLNQKPDGLLNDSPPALQEPESKMKPIHVIGLNTGSCGALTSYKSKMQTQEFQFGVQTEPANKIDDPDLDLESTEPESFHILPADDNEVDTFSSEIDKSDMLF